MKDAGVYGLLHGVLGLLGFDSGLVGVLEVLDDESGIAKDHVPVRDPGNLSRHQTPAQDVRVGASNIEMG